MRASLDDLERRYHSLMERYAIMEGDLEGKSRLEVDLQRVKDELRGRVIAVIVIMNRIGNSIPVDAQTEIAVLQTSSTPVMRAKVGSMSPEQPQNGASPSATPISQAKTPQNMIRDMLDRVKVR
jgi:hypothetical protein